MGVIVNLRLPCPGAEEGQWAQFTGSLHEAILYSVVQTFGR